MYPLPPRDYSTCAVRRVAEGVIELLREPADAAAMFAASPRFPPEGDGWRPLPWLSPRIAAKLPWMRVGNPSGSGYALLRYTLVALSNSGIVELSLTPMATSSVGRIRFLRLCDGWESIDLLDAVPDPEVGYPYRPRFAPWKTGGR